MKKVILNIVFVIFCIVFICCLTYIIHYHYNINEGEQQIDDLKQEIQIEEEQEKNQANESTDVTKKTENKKTESQKTATEKTTSTKTKNVQKDTQTNNGKIVEQNGILDTYKKIHEKNTDMVGWIKIKGTKIDYPVMFTPANPLYYEHRNWKKEDSLAGLPLIANTSILDSNNTIIYAHNMKNGSMFGSLKKYKQKQYYEKNPIIQFDTLYERGQYKIIAVLLAKVYYEKEQKENDFVFYDYSDLNDQNKFSEYIKQIKNRSLYKIQETANYGDKLITLCTCHNHTKNGRLLVVAKKIK